MSRQYFLWETTQRARGRDHHCDKCCEGIYEGQLYTRKLWVTDRHWFVMREHVEPYCEWPELEEVEQEVPVAIKFVVRLEEVVMHCVDGSSEVVTVPRVVPTGETDPDEDDCNGDGFEPTDDMPF